MEDRKKKNWGWIRKCLIRPGFSPVCLPQYRTVQVYPLVIASRGKVSWAPLMSDWEKKIKNLPQGNSQLPFLTDILGELMLQIFGNFKGRVGCFPSANKRPDLVKSNWGEETLCGALWSTRGSVTPDLQLQIARSHVISVQSSLCTVMDLCIDFAFMARMGLRATSTRCYFTCQKCIEEHVQPNTSTEYPTKAQSHCTSTLGSIELQNICKSESKQTVDAEPTGFIKVQGCLCFRSYSGT